MLNGWTEAPTDYNELPWNIKAGRRVLWWIELEEHRSWDDFYPATSFVFCGSFKDGIVEDKIEGQGGGFYYSCIRAYKECGKGPYDD